VLEIFLRNKATQHVVYSLDILLSVVFLLDFLVRLCRAPSRSGYVFRQFGWADLLASLPFPQAKILRIFRVIRVVRLVRKYGPGTIARRLVTDRADSALLSVLFVGILVLEFASLAILRLERNAPEANITTAPDALWYVIVTMSTVGYGDRYPVTGAGRALGTFIIVVGVGIFGTLTAYIANLFLSPKVEQPVPEAPTQTTDPQHTQLCGDAHLSNFGANASPERRLVFDINDFDETLPGPFEWDVKRLATSFVVAGRENGFTRKQYRQAVLTAVETYRAAMRDFAAQPILSVWYAHLDIEQARRIHLDAQRSKGEEAQGQA
jgi:Uncharacterized protein conserved in bacteria (DUF2252)/Ion transport protein